jgi:hypothetical protein
MMKSQVVGAPAEQTLISSVLPFAATGTVILPPLRMRKVCWSMLKVPFY